MVSSLFGLCLLFHTCWKLDAVRNEDDELSGSLTASGKEIQMDKYRSMAHATENAFIICGPSSVDEHTDLKKCLSGEDTGGVPQCIPARSNAVGWGQTSITLADARVCKSKASIIAERCKTYIDLLRTKLCRENKIMSMSDVEDKFCRGRARVGTWDGYESPSATCYRWKTKYDTPMLEQREEEEGKWGDRKIKLFAGKRASVILHARAQGINLMQSLQLLKCEHPNYKMLAEHLVDLTAEVAYRQKSRAVGGIFPKIAQNLAMRNDVIRCPVLRTALAVTQEDNEPIPYEGLIKMLLEIGANNLLTYQSNYGTDELTDKEIKKMQKKLKGPLLLSEVLGVGSVGQVYLVREVSERETSIPGGRAVLKVVFPDNEKAYKQDWNLLEKVYTGTLVDTSGPELELWNLVSPMKVSVMEEFDLRIEAANTLDGRAALEAIISKPGQGNLRALLGDYVVRVPNVYDKLTSGGKAMTDKVRRQAMLLELANGMSLKKYLSNLYAQGDYEVTPMRALPHTSGSDGDVLRWPEQAAFESLALIVEIYGHLILRQGVFMADPHPGNFQIEGGYDLRAIKYPILPVSPATLWILDWGNTGRLDKSARCRLAKAYLKLATAFDSCPAGEQVEYQGSIECKVLENQFDGSVKVEWDDSSNGMVAATDLNRAGNAASKKCSAAQSMFAAFATEVGVQTKIDNAAYKGMIAESLFDTLPLSPTHRKSRHPGAEESGDTLDGLPDEFVPVARSLAALQGAVAEWLERTQPKRWAKGRLQGQSINPMVKKARADIVVKIKTFCQEESNLLLDCFKTTTGIALTGYGLKEKFAPRAMKIQQKRCSQESIKGLQDTSFENHFRALWMKHCFQSLWSSKSSSKSKSCEQLGKLKSFAEGKKQEMDDDEQILELVREEAKQMEPEVSEGLEKAVAMATAKVKERTDECMEAKRDAEAIEECAPGSEQSVREGGPFIAGCSSAAYTSAGSAEDVDFTSGSAEEGHTAPEPVQPKSTDFPERAARRKVVQNDIESLMRSAEFDLAEMTDSWSEEVRADLERHLFKLSSVVMWREAASLAVEELSCD